MKKYWASGKPVGWSSGTLTGTGRRPQSLHPSGGLLVNGVNLAKPLGNGERGAIILPNISMKPSGAGVELNGGDFDPDVVRSALLLFDRIDYPANSMVQLGPECPLGLEDWPGFQRSRANMSGQFAPNTYEVLLAAVFDALDAREEGRWLLARGTGGHSLPSNMMSPLAAFQIKLQNALPLPDRSVPYDEVLSFKNRHQAELSGLRCHLDDLALQVSRDGFGGFAETAAFDRFQRSLGDYIAASRETNFAKRLFSFDISFSWDKLITAGVPSGFALDAVTAGLPIVGAAWGALAAFGSCISVETALGLKRSRQNCSPFQYLIRSEQEL